MGAPDQAAAERAIERLRYGLPPLGMVRALTALPGDGACALLAPLRAMQGGRVALIRGGHGAGKSHLLHVAREQALAEGYAVSLVDIRPSEGDRLDRPEALLGAVCRQLAVAPDGRSGVGALFDAFAAPPAGLPPAARRQREAIASRGRWDYSATLQVPAVYVALRGWVMGGEQQTLDLVADWLTDPARFHEQRRLLYEALVYRQRHRFHDPRPEWQFYQGDALALRGGERIWAALADLDTIARAAGKRGLVLLIDDATQGVLGLDRTAERQAALATLARFWQGGYPGPSYFALTPDFWQACRQYLPLYVGPSPPTPSPQGRGDEAHSRHASAPAPNAEGSGTLATAKVRSSQPPESPSPTGRGAGVRAFFDAAQLEGLPVLDPVLPSTEQFIELAQRLCAVHGVAYGWDAGLPDEEVRRVAEMLGPEASGGVRRAVQALVTALDRRYERQAD